MAAVGVDGGVIGVLELIALVFDGAGGVGSPSPPPPPRHCRDAWVYGHTTKAIA